METPPAFDAEVINAIFKNVWIKSFKEKKDEVDGVEEGVSGTSKRNRLITAKLDALKLSCQLLQEFVTEAVQRSAIIVEDEGGSKIEATHLERTLPQLLLDF